MVFAGVIPVGAGSQGYYRVTKSPGLVTQVLVLPDRDLISG